MASNLASGHSCDLRLDFPLSRDREWLLSIYMSPEGINGVVCGSLALEERRLSSLLDPYIGGSPGGSDCRW